MKQWHQQQKTHNNTGPLRQHLALTIFTELQAKVETVATMSDQDSNWQPLIDKHIILADRRWPFLRWNPSTKSLEPSPTSPLPLTNLRSRIQAALEGLHNPESVVRFQALKPLTESSQVIPWKLQIHPRMEELHQAIQQLIAISAWQLLQVSVKRHTLQESPLASQMRQTMYPAKGNRKGKGKGKSP